MIASRWFMASVSVAAAACGGSHASSPPDGGPGGTVADTGSPVNGADAGAPGNGGDSGSSGHIDAGSHADSGANGGQPGDAGQSAPEDGGVYGVMVGMVPGPGTTVAGCQIFPTNNAWNVDIRSPSLPLTTAYTLPSLSASPMHPDLGHWTPSDGYTYGIPYNVVPSTQVGASISFTAYADESDPGPSGWTDAPTDSTTLYPIADNSEIEGRPATGQTPGDDHLLVLQQVATTGGDCTLFETWATVGGTTAPWSAANGAVWHLGSNATRKIGWTSADAAGLSVFAGLLRLAEVKAGVVNHALRMTFKNSQAGFVPPATHQAPGGTGGALGGSVPPMGLRLRLKASTSLAGWSTPGTVVATAMQRYGLILADNGSDWYFQGDSDDGWDDTDTTASYLEELKADVKKLTNADFDVIDMGPPQQ